MNNPNLEGYDIDIVPVRGCNSPNNATGACDIQFNEDVTFQVTITLEDCEIAQPGR